MGARLLLQVFQLFPVEINRAQGNGRFKAVKRAVSYIVCINMKAMASGWL